MTKYSHVWLDEPNNIVLQTSATIAQLSYSEDKVSHRSTPPIKKGEKNVIVIHSVKRKCIRYKLLIHTHTSTQKTTVHVQTSTRTCWKIEERVFISKNIWVYNLAPCMIRSSVIVSHTEDVYNAQYNHTQTALILHNTH